MSAKRPTATSLIQGQPFGFVFPPRPPIQFPPIDPRTVALRILMQYISELTFYRPGAESGTKREVAPIPFAIPESSLFVEMPDGVVDLPLPCIVAKDVEGGDYGIIGLTSFIEESTRDKFGPGTALQVQSEYQEEVTLEIWASKKPERRAILAGLECALVPTEQMAGIRFLMPDYYDQPVCFTLDRSTRLDDAGSANNRRVATMELEMRFNVVRPVNVVTMLPILDVSRVSEAPLPTP